MTWLEHYPIFVAVEGINNAGKSVFSRALSKRLTVLSMQSTVTREPTHWLRERLDAGKESIKDIGAWMEDRRRHCAELRPLLAQKQIVITDRYYWSTIAYQLDSITGLTPGAMERLKQNILEPDLWVWVDVPLATAQERQTHRVKHEKTERFAAEMDADRKAEERAAWVYRRLALVNGYPAEVVNGDGDIEAQAVRVARKIQSLAGITFDEENQPVSPYTHRAALDVYPSRPPALEDLPTSPPQANRPGAHTPTAKEIQAAPKRPVIDPNDPFAALAVFVDN